MSQWQMGDSFRAANYELPSWSNQEERSASAECWAPQASSFHHDAQQLAHMWRANLAMSEAPLALRFEPSPEPQHLATRLELQAEQAEKPYARDAHEAAPHGNDSQSGSPLSRIYDILDVHSPSTRWLEQRGYMESFKSPDCTLDLTFGMDSRGSKVGAVVTAPDGTKRTVIACEGGACFQRLTAANGQELVKFLSSGQIVELNQNR